VLTISCVTLPKNLSKDWVPSTKHRTSAPIDAFALVEVTYTAEPDKCISSAKDIDCDEILEELPTIVISGTGSGILVDSAAGPVVLSAAHVCTSDVPDAFKHEKISISIKTKTKISVVAPTKGSYDAVVVRLDADKDLCLLKPTTVFTHPVPVATTPPTLGDVVYSISAPFAISGSNLALIFKGFFSGTDVFGDDRKVRFYTVPARPGSSGGPVFNEDWEVIGIIHTAFTTLESVAIGAGLEDVRTFLNPPAELTVEIPETLP